MHRATTLRLTPAARGAIERAWTSARAGEPCGYLLGHGVLVVRAVPGRNVHPRPATAFRLAPEEQLAVRRAARAADLDVLGIWHGHLAGPARPSRADGAGHGPLAPPWMLIVGRGRRGFEWRAWRATSPGCPGRAAPA